jgi:hypothetical protein
MKAQQQMLLLQIVEVDVVTFVHPYRAELMTVRVSKILYIPAVVHNGTLSL